MICLLAIGDGRDETHILSFESARTNLPRFDRTVVVDDAKHELGFGGAIRQGWERVLATGAKWVFHLELDFLFHAPVPLTKMAYVLDHQPNLAQIALKRQPVNDLECAAGGIVEQDPESYTDNTDGFDFWTEHRIGFTTNPSLYSTQVCRRGWPDVEHSEGNFSHAWMNEDPDVRFAYWGRKLDEPLVEHIGARRGTGY